VHFRVWAPACKEVSLVLNSESTHGLPHEGEGYFSALVPQVRAGDLYHFRIDGAGHRYPDPASRFQPDGPHGPSQVIDPSTFKWSDPAWAGVGAADQVLYEVHVGTFTREGTWAAAMDKLPRLAEMGITCLEVMPVSEFPGNFGWGYDGVDLFAPTRLYGKPDDFRRFVDRAHGVGIGVILDVVYNHIGPDGNYLKAFSRDYFSTRHKTDWGEAINYDGKSSGPVREFFISNARYWIDEFHLDGFRFDATQNIYDDSKDHVLAAITRAARESAGGRRIYLIAENEPQETRIVRPQSSGGFGMDGLWNDDFHHSALVRISGHNEAYYSDYLGKAGEFVAACKWGYLYQGQPFTWQKKRRGTPALDLPPTAFVNFIENHDQLANFAHGMRARQMCGPGVYRAMTALLLLAPQTPMLFQGQEFGASSPFVYFADHHEELAKLVRKGRGEFMKQFPSHTCKEMESRLPDPGDVRIFERCKLEWSEWERNGEIVALYRDLLKVRHEDPVLRVRRARGVDGAVLSGDAFVLRFFADRAEDDRLLLVNFGTDLLLAPAPEPLLAPPAGREWRAMLLTEDPKYGGNGTSPLESPETGWRVRGQAAVLMKVTTIDSLPR
jgi:maltooligosyltrehalose trehalohydrolase